MNCVGAETILYLVATLWKIWMDIKLMILTHGEIGEVENREQLSQFLKDKGPSQ